MPSLPCRLVGRPVMRFIRCIAAPAIERVVEHQPGFELGKIIRIHPRQSERRRQKAGRLGREIGPSRVGATTMRARCRSGSVASPNSSTITSNVHSSPR